MLTPEVSISIHAPRGGSDKDYHHHCQTAFYFNPRSPWGERLCLYSLSSPPRYISIHAPRGGSDAEQLRNRIFNSGFQSTLPVGGATNMSLLDYYLNTISIHAPRGGSDASGKSDKSAPKNFNPRSPWGERRDCQHRPGWYRDFNPRSPWGERLSKTVLSALQSKFQSTLPVGGATMSGFRSRQAVIISIHAPRGGSDCGCGTAISRYFIFQSTLPVGGATVESHFSKVPQIFQSTLPVGGATQGAEYDVIFLDISIHAPRGGSDTIRCFTILQSSHFNPRSPWGERQQRCTDFLFLFGEGKRFFVTASK